MNYKLAKELEKAGFPQYLTIGSQYYTFISHPRMGVPPQQAVNTVLSEEHARIELKNGWVKHPTLEELIEACGDGFRTLIKDNGLYIAPNKNTVEYTTHDMSWYETPEEAVARLWLALQKNK